MQKGKVTNLLLNRKKSIAVVICVLLLAASQITPLFAQLNSARDLTGTWQSSASGMYYDMDPSDSTTRMNDVTATFSMDITQSGNQITIVLNLNPTSWVTDNAYWQEFQLNGAPPVGGSIEFTGTVSSSSFSADEQGSQLTQEHLSGTFTSDIITATLTGTSETTDPNGIVVTRTSSTTTPTLAPTSSPSTTNQPTFNRYFGNVAVNKGSAWSTNTGSNVPLSSGKMGSGTTVLTGNNSVVGFTYPMQDGTVYLGDNTEAGWVALISEPAPDNGIVYSMYPSTVTLPSLWGQDAKDMLISIPLEAALAVALFGEAAGTAAAVTIVVEGGVFLIHYGQAYIQETRSHVVGVSQGLLAGQNTKYVVDVSDSSTTVQVIEGPVVFIDPVTNNTVTVDSGQMLTLPTGQTGFSQQSLQSDVSDFNSATINQWWTQPTPNVLGGFANVLPIIIVIITVAAVVAIAAVAVSKRKGNRLQQPGVASQKPGRSKS